MDKPSVNDKNLRIDNRFSKMFFDGLKGGAVVFCADDSHRILYVNPDIIRLFECDSIEDFFEFTGGCIEGVIHEPAPDMIFKETETQLAGSADGSGYCFYNIVTKKENVRRIVSHWTLVHDGDMGDLFYAYLFPHRMDNSINDFDVVTGLLGKRKFDGYAKGINRKYHGQDKDAYAIIYLNLANFKLLNLEMGVNEGNECLRAVGRILSGSYDNSFVSRISDDHFAVFAKYDGIFDNTKKAESAFYDEYGSIYNVTCKFGIYKFFLSPDFDVETALSRAKIACDYIRKDTENDIAEYSEELAMSMKTMEYVVSRIDEAIEKEWIKVYFQPVVRSLTHKICGAESLVRWIDPEIGFLSPDMFIGALEEGRCIHKLDAYVIERVCARLSERLCAGLFAVPVSVNFSRLDFILCDMLEIVEAAVEKYKVPKEYIHIEITESMIASDEQLMRKVIDDFAGAGYKVWMDDFGSGYSSLTVLKDYNFDMLKMDMRFLTPLTDKSKSVIRSVVTMAKDIGMKTLAEGVETEEQLDFLTEIGCGMIQGYYYGKPEPFEDAIRHLMEKGMEAEEAEWRDFYQTASFHARATDVPLEIIEDDGENFTTLFMNRSYISQIFNDALKLDEIDKRIYHTDSSLVKKYREFANIIEMSGKTETFYYTEGGNYLCLTARVIAQHAGHYLIEGTLLNLSQDNKSDDRKRLDTMLKEMNLLFESVQAVNINENTIVPLLGNFKYLDREAVEGRNLQRSILFFANRVVHPDEKEKCLEFLRSDTLADRVERSELGYIADIFRLKKEDGTYHPCEAYIMVIPGTRGNEYLFCVKRCVGSHK